MKKVLSVKDGLPKKTIVSFPRPQSEIEYRDYSRLTLFDKVFLGTLLSEGLNSSRSYIKPINMLSGQLMPNTELLIGILRELVQDKILIACTEQNHSYHPYTLNNESFNVYTRRSIHPSGYGAGLLTTPFQLNCDPSEMHRVINELTNPTANNSISEFELLYQWQSLVAWECVEYLEYKIIQLFGVAFVDKDEMFNVMTQHLTELSQSEIFKTIESSAFYALSYANQKGISKERGAENVLTTFQIFADNAINKEGWYKRGFEERPRDAPQCLVLKFLLKKVLNREDNGFDVVFETE